MNLLRRPHRRLEEDRTAILEYMRQQLRQKESQWKDTSFSFWTGQAVSQVVTEEHIYRIFAPCDWDVKRPGITQIIRDQLKRILCILIRIEWTSWNDFQRIFFSHPDSRIQPTPNDHDLPFSEVKFLPEEYRSLFEREQYSFCPIVIKEGTHNTYSAHRRLPFLASETVGGGLYGRVEKIEIQIGHLVYDTDQHRNEPNQKVKNTSPLR